MQNSNNSLSTRAASYCHRPAPYRFGLSSLMLLVTLASILMGVLTTAPILGVSLCVFSIVAVCRTVVQVRRVVDHGHEIGIGRKISLFVFHLFGVAVVVAIAMSTFMFAGSIGVLALAALFAIFDSGAIASLGAFIIFLAACFLAAFVTFQIWKATSPD